MNFLQGHRHEYFRVIPKIFSSILILTLSGCSFIATTERTIISTIDEVRGRFGGQEINTFDAHISPPGIKSVSIPIPMLPSPRLVTTPEVERELREFLRGERGFIEKALDRKAQYSPMLEQIFRDEGVPEELIALALVESGYNPNARSPVGAVGMWQFMRSTARLYGLKVKNGEDQRRDPVLSTIAAARLLRDLYFFHGDWHLALAAYNAGSGGVNSALNRAKCDDYWTLVRKRKLTTQTSRFVPRFIAAAMIIRGRRLGTDFTQLAQNLNVKRNDNKQIEFANWTGNRHPSAG